MQQNNGVGRSQLISFAVLSLILMGIMFYFQSKQKPQEQAKAQTTQSAQKSNAAQLQNQTNAASIQKVQLKNDLLTVDFTTLGGQISTVKLNKFNAFDEKVKDKPVLLFANNNADYGFQFKDKSGKVINTKDLVFNATTNGNAITMQANVGAATIQFVYTLLDKYTVDFKVRTQGLSQVVSDNKADFVWNYNVREAEKGRSQEQTHTEFVYAFNNYKSYDYDSRGDMDETKETLNWIGVKQQFFSAVIEAQNGFKNSKGNQETIEKGEFLKKFNYNGQVDLAANELNQDFKWYFMPLDLNLLKSYDKNFDEILPFGWSFIGSLNRWFFIPVYNLLSSWGIAAGWVIFLMTIAVKIILSPIMYKQHKLSAMMRVIRPEIEEAQEKFKNADPMKKQQATMEVYRKAGVNQFAGCLPGLVQIPIFYALFRFFPNMLDLRGKSFWFANDLTAYDDLIKLPFNVPFLGEHLSVFALACTVVILIYTVMTAGNMQQPTQEGMPNMKPLMYIFPVTFLFFLNSAASGLSWYYFVSNAINIVIILVIKYFILDEKRIHAQIQENKAKPKKEGRFQSRMREMMEKAQEQQKQMEQIKQQQNKKK
ncbi:preprotein translocase YidC [Elizabethkingia meningoseptica]|uniref:membrane protein insertase YidC n=1 Tax=Elizabethkingia meningoseptica TaxID=238 RepID=UPI000332C407|nr:membrane protein insertase YidC [Elizabethkingia meningoseptica]AQX03871.1 preprotein translocase YidC [Elizabethkingia meningoseptica]AQX45910.1 preprotein translocase YidC [Elizabethkingia meningoseptica]EOR29005.1 OxaI/YidC membrane insertion protein [Elizabethkingia meningoseptica ATCC 13253 = NBRC 12535]KUY15203.1 preprotein translocase YidC [Elizabethkingia meningoseptica]MDE5488671.1 membrane protein insertase YidC [Elizabethkingia meningoseptica]